MEKLITHTLQALILPPGGIIVLLVIGLFCLGRYRRSATILLCLGIVSLYALSTPFTARTLTQQLEIYPAVTEPVGAGEQAIVVLGGGRYANAPEYGGDTVGTSSLARVRYGAYLHRKTGLPMLVSGGSVFNEPVSEAALMAETLANEFGIPQVWVEGESRNTAENARFSRAFLEKQGIFRIYLVTDARHMRRAVGAFEKAGMQVTPAPTLFSAISSLTTPGLFDWLPSAGALSASTRALHEMLGLLWYRIRY